MLKTKTYLIYLLLSAGISFSACAQKIQSSKDQIRALLNDIARKYPSASVSFNLSDPSAGAHDLISYNPGTALAPASNIKVITTAAALTVLGTDFRFRTVLGFTGTISPQGILDGDIVISGSGDPTLGSDRITGCPDLAGIVSLWAEAISAKGIKEIKGNIVADNSRFGRNPIPGGWVWTDIGNYYGAGSSGLNINENMYRVFFKPGQEEGKPAEFLRTEPDIPGLTFINDMKTGPKGSGDNGYIFGGAFSDIRYLSGTIPAGVDEFSIKGSIPDPSLFAAQLLKAEVEKKGIKVAGNAFVEWRKEIIPSGQLHTFESPALSEIIAHTNQSSINLFAEALLNAMGLKKYGRGDTKAGLEAIKDYLTGKDIDQASLFMADGSGLSPQNAVSAETFTRILNAVAGTTGFETYLASFPVAGRSGTLSGLCRGTDAEGNIYAKSGSFERVLGYTGYVRSNSGKFYSFSILVNNYTGKSYQLRKEIEKLFVLMARL